MDEKKLRIPGPDEGEDLTKLDNGVFYGLMLCVLIAGLIAVYTKHHASRAEIRALQNESEAAPRSDIEARQRELVAEHEEDFDEHEWEGDDATAALRYGPREAAEAACRDAFGSGQPLGRAVRVELVAAMNRGAEHTPWACLTRAYLNGRTAEEGQLHEQLDDFWDELEQFQAPSGVVSQIAEAFRQREIPDDERYRDWLFVCAFQPSTPGDDCRASLQQLYENETLLGIYDAMIRRFDERDVSETAMGRSMEGLSSLAKTGELDGWTRSTDINREEVRLGAIFWMCRLTNSPRTKLAWTASVGLSDVGNQAVRAGDQKLIPRWREACRHAFQKGGTPEDPEAPALAVWSGVEGEAPVYTLRAARDRGDCQPTEEGAPLWMCGVEAWKGPGEEKLQTELMDFFTETRWIEWRD